MKYIIVCKILLINIKNKMEYLKVIHQKNFTNYVHKPPPYRRNKIVIHGTAGGTAQGAISWMNNPNGAGKNVSVNFVIDEWGRIISLFPEQFYSYHAGSNFRIISESSFGIEIVNWLNLDKKGDKFYSWTNTLVDSSRVKQVSVPWRGYKYFHTITNQQFTSLCIVLKYLCEKYNIRKKFYRNYDPNGNFNTKDFTGILMHSTFHPTKMDFEPSIIPIISI